MQSNIPVDWFLGMLDYFLWIIYRIEGVSDQELFQRGRLAAQAFDDELAKMGIAKQIKKLAYGLYHSLVGIPVGH